MATKPPDDRDANEPTGRPLPRGGGQASTLPRPLTSLVGRKREIAVIRDRLLSDDVRLVTLTGPGGVGKTRLAIAVANQLAGEFADGVCFVALAPILDPELVAPTIARTLGVRETSRPRLADRLITYLRGKSLLLVLDNFEQVVAAAPLISELLGPCPRLKILVTSRAVLHLSGEHDVAVPPLAVPDPDRLPPLEQMLHYGAIRLFGERAQAAKSDFAVTPANARAVAAICRRLDGLPLAIELAAARSALFPATAMLPRLARRLPVLTGGPRDAPARLRTMRDAIAWSYDLLTEEEQILFRHLAVFAGGFTLEAAEYVGERAGGREGGDDDSPLASSPSRLRASSVLDGIASLVDKSLVQPSTQHSGAPSGHSTSSEPRVEMLETIREFGLEQLEASAEEAATRATHAAYYLALTEQAELRLIVAGSASWVDRLATELPNLRAAVAWALETNRAEEVLRLAGTLLSMAYARGDPAEGQRWLEAALAQPGDAPPAIQADALFTASAMAQLQGEFARSIAFNEEGLALARAFGYAFGEARALTGLGITAEWQGDLDRAASFYEASNNVMQTIDDLGRMRHWRVLPLANLGDVALLLGNPTRATALTEEALRQWRQEGYLWGIAQALGTQAAAASAQGNQGRAAHLYDEALTQWLACSDLRGIAGTLAGIAGVAGARGQFERAACLLGAAWALADAVGVHYLAHHLNAERVLAATRVHLGEPAFGAAWAAGRGLTMEQAIAEARAVVAIQDDDARPSHGLTPRELDVLRLLAGGRTDREIAEALFIGPRTVQTHVANLFAKLDVNSRAEASVVAVRRGLV